MIEGNIGNHLKERTSPPKLRSLPYPIRQDFVDIINKYDFNKLPLGIRIIVIPMAKK